MSNGGSGMLPKKVNRAIGVKNIGLTHDIFSFPSLFLSHIFPSLFTFCVEEAASCRRDRLSKSISSKPKLDHPNYVLPLPIHDRKWIG
jgi:hypothetical protein